MAFDAVKAEAKDLLIAKLASKKLATDADKLLDLLKQGASVEEIAKANKLEWQLELSAKRTSTKTPREVITTAFRLPAAGLDKQAISSTSLNSGDVIIMAVNNVQEGKSKSIQSYERQALKGFLARARSAGSLQAMQSNFEDQSDIQYYR